MTEKELNQLGYYIERYGSGYMLADESNRTETPQGARYCGVSMAWRFQPLCADPFPTKEAAILAAAGVHNA